MFDTILSKLVIIGVNPENQEYSIVIDDNKVPETQYSVSRLAVDYIGNIPNWYNIIKQTFVIDGSKLYLVYNVVIPKNHKILKGKWLSMIDIDSLDVGDKHVILEGTKI